MEILYPLVGVICLSLTPALAYQLQSEYSGHVSLQPARKFEPRGEGIRKLSVATNIAEDFSNARFKEIKAVKRYSSPSFISQNHRKIEVPAHFKKNIENDSSENNLIDRSKVRSNQKRGSRNSDVLQAMSRERIDRRRMDVVAPAIFRKKLQNQSNENYSIDKSEAHSNQRRSSHNSDRLQAKPSAKQPKDYVREFIESHQDILQTKTYEKPSFLAVNVHKVQVTTAPLSLNVRGKFPTKMVSDQIHKMQTANQLVSPQADEPMQGEKHAADSDRKPDVRAQEPNQKDMSFKEYSKREAQIDRSYKDPPNHGFSDSLKRYISFRDKGTEEPKSPVVQAAIGIRTDNIEKNIPVENPYAIFYKMHQNLDDGFIPAPGGALVSVEEDSKMLNRKNKQLSVNYETKNPNRVMKKFFNFNSNKHY